MNSIRSKRLLGLFLFIDFRKAFDLVDSRILIKKLSFYGFDDASLNLILDYFSDRKLTTKYNNVSSELKDIKHGVPQGSVLGPLFFLIFINDLPFFLDSFNCKLFADDTTLSMSDKNYDGVMSRFNSAILKIKEWCKFNKTDINWSKTEIMFVGKKMAYNSEGLYRLQEFPSTIAIDGKIVKVVDSFKLLGITIDKKLNFLKYVGDIRLAVNKRLFSIKKLFYLSFNVKLQFFKTFILPYFDYCATLFIYFNKTTVQKIANCYYLCLFRLLSFKFTAQYIDSKFDFNHLNNELEKLNLQAFQHRVLSRLLLFGYKVINYNDSPINLSERLKLILPNYSYDLRSNLKSSSLIIPNISYLNNYGSKTFEFTFPKLLNLTCVLDLNLSISLFKIRIYNNINIHYKQLIQTFSNFDLNFVTFSI
jgi:hypothetical protein